MGINGVSNAASYMAILTGKSQQEKATGTDFASLLAQASQSASPVQDDLKARFLEKHKDNVIRDRDIPPQTSFTDYVRSPVTEKTSWRESENYSQFRENYLNPVELIYTDDMFDIDDDGIKTLNRKGLEQFNNWRMDNLSPMTPDTIDDAKNRYDASYDHLNDYIHTMFKDNGIEVDFNYQPQSGINGKNYFIGAAIPSLDSNYAEQREKFQSYLTSDAGKEMRVMAEEVQFYGAITKLAEANSDFRDAYNTAPDAAINAYANKISEVMGTIEMPRIQTIPNPVPSYW